MKHQYRISSRCVTRFLGLFLCYCTSLLFMPLANAEVNSLADQLRNEAPKAWLSYLRVLGNYQLDTKETYRDGNGITTREETSRFVGAYPYCLVERDIGAKQEFAKGYNQEYEFRISRSKKGPWVVDNLHPIRRISPIQELSFPDYGLGGHMHSVGQETAYAMTKGLLVTIVDSLPMLFTKKEFRIIGAQKVKEDGVRLVHMKYSYEPDRFVPNQLARSGEVFLMPEQYWLIKHAKVFAAEPPNKRVAVETTNEYDSSSEQIPWLREHRMVLSGPGYSGDTIEFVSSGFSKTADTDPKRFTLSAYDIPKPVFPGPDRSRVWLFCITLALLVFCIVLFVYRRYRRWQRT